MKFLKCNHCGNVATMLYDMGVPMECCGESMQELVANSTDAVVEKHLPVLTLEGDVLAVEVGSVAHPMQENHFITLIAVVNGDSEQIFKLKPNMAPKIECKVDVNKPVVAYAYCNIHGLWKSKI